MFFNDFVNFVVNINYFRNLKAVRYQTIQEKYMEKYCPELIVLLY